MTYNNSGVIGSQDGDIQIALNPGHRPTPEYVKELRDKLPENSRERPFSFLPADIVSQILNFGTPTPIDLQIRGPKLGPNFDYAQKILRRIKLIRASRTRASSNPVTIRGSR